MNHLSITLVWTLLIATLQGCGGSSPEEPAIRTCFENYKKAILAADGQAAVAEVNAATLAYYGQMLKLSLKASKAETEALGLMDRLMVFTTRHRVPADVLKTMDTKAYFVYAVENGWIGDITKNMLGEIEVKGNTATGMHMVGSQKTNIFWQFSKEEGKWKADITAIMPIAEMAFKQIIAEAGENENTFLFDILGQVSGKDVDEKTIWEPVGSE